MICSGNDRWAIYLWGWFAHMVQFPEEKPEVQDCVSRRTWLQRWMDYERKVDEDCCFIRKYPLWKLCEDDC